MLRRFGHLLLAIALIGATGGHWAALQSVAWATMFADNARVEPISVALEKTFDGKHLCPLCKQIAKGRQAEKKSDVQLEIKKLEFLRTTTSFVIVPPSHFTLLGDANVTLPLLTQAPLLRPPRPVLG